MLEVAGIALLPPLKIFLGFALAGLALNLVPGADMAFVIASAARGGRRAGILAALGIGIGAFAHILAAVLGLSALLAASDTAFTAVKYAGAAYLLYLALTMLRGGGASRPAAVPAPRSVLRSAILVNILNPKVALFFLAFLPQFVDPAAPAPWVQILTLGLWFDLVGTLVNVIVALVAAGAAARVRRWRGAERIARWIGASVMGALAVQLMVAERR